MAQKGQFLGVDIGSASLKAVLLEAVGSEVWFRGAEIVEFSVPPDSETISETIKDILSRFSVKQLALSLPGRQTLIRSISIPAVAGSRLIPTLRTEVQHRLPFPLEQVFWDYSRLPNGEKMIDFVVGAIKKEIVQKFLDPFTKLKEEIAFLDTDPLVLAYLVTTFPDFNTNNTYAILDIGAESSNLVVFRGSLIMVRSLTVSGHTLTDALKEEKGIEEVEAEKEKHSVTAAEMPESIRASLDALLTEIQTSLDFWRFTQKGPELNHLFLTGGTALIDGIVPFLEGRLRVPTRLLDPLVAIQVPAEVQIEPMMRGRLAIATGLALRGLAVFPVPYPLDFLSPEYQRLIENRRNRIFLYLSSLLGVILSFTPGIFFYQETRLKEAINTQLNIELNEFEQYLPQVQDAERELKELQARYQSLTDILSQRHLWLSRLITVGRLLPSRQIYLTKFTPQDNTLLLDGIAASPTLSLNFNDVRQFILNLNAAPIFQNATVTSLERNDQGQLVFQVTVGIK